VQIVLNVLAILEEVAVAQPVGVSDLSRRLALPKSTVYRGLKALETAGWVRANGEERKWILMPKSLDVGQRVIDRLGDRLAIMGAMQRLRDVTQETVHLAILEGNEMVIVDRSDSPRPVRSFYPLGFKLPVHAASTGKAVLAHLSKAELDVLVPERLDSYTDRTLTSSTALRVELEEVRRLGYASNRGEFRPEVGSVAAALVDGVRRPFAALSISAPIERMPEAIRPRFGQLVAEAAAKLAAE
jgi:IclR family acetate operon transcriptional repressor